MPKSVTRSAVDKVVLFSVIIGGGGLFSPFFVVKEHRLDTGEAKALLETAPWVFVAMIGILAGIALIGLRADLARTGDAVLIPATVLFAVLWLSVGIAATAELVSAGFDRGRVSPTTGFWMLLLSAFVLFTHGHASARNTIMRNGLVPVLLLLLGLLFGLGILDDLAFVREYYTRESRFAEELVAHIGLAGAAVGVAVLVGIPLGILAYRSKRMEKPVFAMVSGLQTVPSLALFGLMIAPLAILSQRYPVLRAMGVRGVGNTPALLALFLYALLPVVRNTFTSLRVMDPAVIHAGTGMGMTRRQLLWRVEVPIALPIILSGIRVSAVQTIGNTTVAALIGAGGLGNFVFQGLGQAAPDLIVMGVIPIVILAVTADRLFQFLADHAVPGPQRRRIAYD
ncbi:MAG: ABC transporter permease [Spirochaetales bacterium]